MTAAAADRQRPTAAAVALLTALAMAAFAANSMLCRQALAGTDIDAASFTTIRLAAGAVLLVLLSGRGAATLRAGSWRSAVALLAYAAGFSFAYRELTAGTGALLLFGAVQVTMIGHGLRRGDRLGNWQWLGFSLACGGLIALLLPGLSAPPLLAATWMVMAGLSWGVYSLRGRGVADPIRTTAGNFVRATPLAVAISIATAGDASFDTDGCIYAVLSGAIASGLGYAIWYRALRGLAATSAATIQLSVPAITALGGATLLGEPLTTRLLLAGAAIIGGIALVLRMRRPAAIGS